MFKTILMGFQKFYKKLFRVYEHSKETKDNIIDKKQIFMNFIEELGLFKFLAE